MTLIWVFVCFVCALLCWVSFIGVLHGGRFVLHGPNLGISVGIGVLLCWVSFIGVFLCFCCLNNSISTNVNIIANNSI